MEDLNVALVIVQLILMNFNLLDIKRVLEKKL